MITKGDQTVEFPQFQDIIFWMLIYQYLLTLLGNSFCLRKLRILHNSLMSSLDTPDANRKDILKNYRLYELHLWGRESRKRFQTDILNLYITIWRFLANSINCHYNKKEIPLWAVFITLNGTNDTIQSI